MFTNNRGNPNIFGGGGQPTNTFPNNNNMFGNNNTQPQNNAFNNNAQQQNNLFNRGNATTPQTNNMFGQNQGAQGNTMFNNQGQGNMFNAGANTQTNNMFGQNTQQNNALFNQQRPAQGNNIFGQNTQQGFNQGNQQAGNIFGQNTQQQGAFLNQNTQQQGNIFGQNTQAPMVGAGNPQNPMLTSPVSIFNLLQFPPEQQAALVKQLTNKQIKQFIDGCFKNLVEPKRLENMTLGTENTIRNEKVNAFAAKHNIKPQLLQVKKEVRDKMLNPIKDLKQKDQALINASSQLAFKVTEKLQKYKECLIEAISENKMIEDIKREITDIDNQIKEFLKPLFNSHQTRSSYSFIDPDQFCIKISEQILKNISYLDNKMDELLACEGEVPQEATDTGEIIEKLVEYYENVVISLRQFSEKYQKQKKEVLSKRKVGSSEEILRRIMEKANMSVRKELKAYELVKEIEQILQKREKKNADMMMLE